MSDASPILGLPFLLPAQAQKHVTHNEALRLLDALVQLAVADRTRTAPPTDPAVGDRHIVAAGATGAWAGRDGQVALREEGAWAFLAPRPGWTAQVIAEGRAVVWDGAAWIALSDQPQSFPRLGVNAASDAVNRLAVAAEASLFTHAGAGHQLKLNKAAAADTASLVFQTGFSGRAEFGTAGSDDFSVKVSPDGSVWHTAFSLDPATGRTRVHGGLRMPDGAAASPALAFADDPDTGLARPGADQIGLVAGGVQRALLSPAALQLDVPLTGTAVVSSASDVTSGRVLVTNPGPAQAFRRGNVLGTVSQSGGTPTGALIERGSNANGDYVRFADGTQLCWHVVTASLTITAGFWGGFRSGGQNWTYPAAFSAAPAMAAYALNATAFGTVSHITPTAATGTWAATAVTSQATAADRTVALFAAGRWF